MSIKLYNAYRLDVSSLDDLYTRVRDFKAALYPDLINLQVEMIVRRAVRLYDAAGMKTKVGIEYDLTGLRKELWDAQNTLVSQRQALILSGAAETRQEDGILSLVLALQEKIGFLRRENTSFLFNAYIDVMSSVLTTDLSAQRGSPCFESDIVVFRHDNEFYGVMYSDNQKIIQRFLALGWVKDFSYYDNVSPPEDVPVKEFRRRGRVWNAILGASNYLNDEGVTFGITSSSSLPGLLSIEDEISLEVARIPGVAERAKEYALDQYTLKRYQELSTNSRGVFAALRQARKEAQDQDLIEDIKRLSGLLTEISIENLKSS